MPIEKVTKRSGEVVDFNPKKIERAIAKANKAMGAPMTDDTIRTVTTTVVSLLEDVWHDNVPGVEDVQDIVEQQIAAAGYWEVAKDYILFRYKQREVRQEQQEKVVEKAKTHQISVTKRDGSPEPFDVNHITEHLIKCAADWREDINIDAVIGDAMDNMYDGVTISEINQAVVMALKSKIEADPSYSKIAARVLLNDLYKDVINANEFSPGFTDMYRQGLRGSITKGVEDERLDKRLLEFNFDILEAELDPERDHLFEYMGAQVLADRYFLKDLNQQLFELPQYFWMRVAMGLALNEPHREVRALEFYHIVSQLYYVPSTPTLFHSGTTHPQMSSCYLTTVEDDLANIFKSFSDNAQLSKWSGGLGNDWTNIRGTGSLIKSTNVGSQGVIPFLKIADATTAAINRSGKRRGATCAYLETWHYDIEDFIELRKNTGDDRRRTHDMNTANWIPDLFMKRVMADASWTLFSPDETSDLHHLYGRAFDKRYEEYEHQVETGEIKLYKKLQAKDLWRKMVTMLFETGHPWMTFKDPSNIRSPQDHVGVVHSSNLCTEITLNTSKDETAVCNLGSINLVRHIWDGHLNREKLAATVKTAGRMLDNVIDLNYYPIPESQNSNKRHRPVGLGIMGLQDALYELDMQFDSEAAVNFSDTTMEFIAYHMILGSSELARDRGVYESFKGSKWDRGLYPLDTLQLLEDERGIATGVAKTRKMDWEPVRQHVKKYGMRNSNTMAIAPTATIANISGVFPSIEPIYKNVYVKSNFSGEFTTNNQYLINDLKQCKLWDQKMLDDIKAHDGSIQQLERIPEKLRLKYKEVFEIDPIWILKHAAYRGKWIDQSQSVNIFLNTTSGKAISEIYAQAWMMGLKTTYYLRSLGASAVEKSTIDIGKQRDLPSSVLEKSNQEEEPVVAMHEPSRVAEPVYMAANRSAQTTVQPVSLSAAAARSTTTTMANSHRQNKQSDQVRSSTPSKSNKSRNIYIAPDAICEACE